MRRSLPFVLAGTALLLSAAAFTLSLRRTKPTPGRLLELAPPQSYTTRQPIPYTLDDFELMKLTDGSLVALCIYPPGFFGHTQGCTIRWKTNTPNAQVAQDGGPLMPAANGVRDGHVWVDSRHLQCSRGHRCERIRKGGG